MKIAVLTQFSNRRFKMRNALALLAAGLIAIASRTAQASMNPELAATTPGPAAKSEERARTPVGPVIGAVGESSGVFHMGSSGCNAWVVDGHHIVTNNHCVSGGGVKVVFYRQGGKIEITNCKPTPVTRSVKLDYALFKCPGIGEKVPPVRIADRQPKLNEKFTLVTHDLQNPSKQRRADGKVGAPFTIAATGGTGFEARGATVISGNSGSVVYDKDGNALGLVWGAETTNAKAGVMSSLKDVVADIKAKTSDVAFNLTSDPNSLIAGATPSKPAEKIEASPSTEPDTFPDRSADQPIVSVQPQQPAQGTARIDPMSPAPALDMNMAAAKTESNSFQDNLPMIALAGAAIVGGILIYKVIRDQNKSDRKLADIQAQLWAQQNAAATTTSSTPPTAPDPVLTTQVSSQVYANVNTSLKRHDVPQGGVKFKIAGVKIVPAVVKQLQPVKMPFLRPDYVGQRPADQPNSRKLRMEANVPAASN